MRAEVRCRVELAGAEMRLLVLGEEPGGLIGIDLDSGAFVRALHPPSTSARLAPLDVVAGRIGPPVDPPDCARPEAVVLDSAPRRVGRVHARRADRFLAPLTHPPQPPLLGFSGPSIPYWTLSGDRPSLTIVTPELGPQLRWTSSGFECRFSWMGALHQYPLGDRLLAAALTRADLARCSGRELARILRYTPRRLLVVLTPPIDGYCFKKVAALLPGSRRGDRT